MLHTSDLQKKSDAKKQQTKLILKTLLEQVYKKINYRNNYDFFNNKKEVICIIPLIQMGLPLYDINKCLKYIIAKLKKGGFYIVQLDINKIKIVWHKH
tara:strand:- start:293 stop:586 length:294 start_codon:yes stop_codon:yes gene_type:complete